MNFSIKLNRHAVKITARRAMFVSIVGLIAPVSTRLIAATPVKPDFGPNVQMFDSSMPAAAIQQQIDKVYAVQQKNEFGHERNAFLFLPGEYHVDIPVGFYTEVIGLGASPDSVKIVGNVHADGEGKTHNATGIFWRAVEGLAVKPTGGTMQWAVSQAAPLRRVHIQGSIALHQQGGWVSGGWMSDSLVDGNVDAGPQQQWISRNSEWKSWTGSNWNMVFVGVPNSPAGEWPEPAYTKVALTPVVREKPFLAVDAHGQYAVRVPALVHGSAGITWHSGSTPGMSIPLSRFYIARPEKDTAATINAQLAKGKNLLFTPGIYELTEAIRVTRPNTVVIGLGYATLRPVRGTAAMTTADIDGVIIAGLLFDAGAIESPVLLQVGPDGSKVNHAANPISLHDIFFRVGGAGVSRVKANLTINCNNTILDHTWIWRADHGPGVGWKNNTSANGLVVSGDDVTVYGLFVEHHQQFQVLWNGNGGRTYLYQSEIPYDAPDQVSYTSAPGTNGWASYKVADQVKSHEAWGLGIYSVFWIPGVNLTRAVEVPKNPNVRFHDVISVSIAGTGIISNVINDAGGATSVKPRVLQRITEYPAVR